MQIDRLETWMQHQTRDAFWKHGSVCENFDDIEVPVYAVSGWADGYCRAVFRLVENLKGPAKGLVGPWSHRYPHVGAPGPAIDWLSEETRWWDQWLKRIDTGIADEPPLRVYLQDHAAPRTHYEHRDGHWITEPAWPSPNVTATEFALGSDGRLSRSETVPGGWLDIASPLWVGFQAGKWCSYALPGDQPGDQRREDAGSLGFETGPLAEPLHMVGDPCLTLTFITDRPVAQVAVRLMDVAPDGAATRVSYGLLNLTHREGHEHPVPLTPGQTYTMDVPMKHVAQTFRAGHRIRLGLSTCYFPVAWPAPEPVTLRVLTGQSTLTLPLRNGDHSDEAPFGTPRAAAPLDQKFATPPTEEWTVTEDSTTGRVTANIRVHEGAAHITDHGLTHSAECAERYSILPDDPTSAEGEVTWEHVMQRDGWAVRTVTHTHMRCDATHFHLRARMQAFEGKTPVRDETYTATIPRQSV